MRIPQSQRHLGPDRGVRHRSPGWWLQTLALAHGGIGAVVYREPLGDIARDRVIGSVPEWGDRSTAFWFLAAAPALWLGGRLLRSAESADDRDAQRAAGALLVAVGTIGSASMPRSGFYGVVVVGLAALRRGRRPQQASPAGRRARGPRRRTG